MRHLPQAPIGLARAISDCPHYWTVCMSALWVDEQGKQRYGHDTQTMAVRYMQENLVEHLNAEHQKMLKRFEKEAVWCAGWIAVPQDFNVDNKLADEIYTSIGAWVKQGE